MREPCLSEERNAPRCGMTQLPKNALDDNIGNPKQIAVGTCHSTLVAGLNRAKTNQLGS